MVIPIGISLTTFCHCSFLIVSTIGHSNRMCPTFGAETQSQLYPLLMLFVTNNFHITLIFHKSEQYHLENSHQWHPVFKFIPVDLKSFNPLYNKLVAVHSLFSLSFSLSLTIFFHSLIDINILFSVYMFNHFILFKNSNYICHRCSLICTVL